MPDCSSRGRQQNISSLFLASTHHPDSRAEQRAGPASRVRRDGRRTQRTSGGSRAQSPFGAFDSSIRRTVLRIRSYSYVPVRPVQHGPGPLASVIEWMEEEEEEVVADSTEFPPFSQQAGMHCCLLLYSIVHCMLEG